MELADVEFRLRKNSFGLSQWIVFGRFARSYIIGSDLRRYCGLFGASPDTADVRREAGDAEVTPASSSNHLRMLFMLCPPC
jgi:hypothetical protein